MWVGIEIFKVLHEQTDKQFVILLKKKKTRNVEHLSPMVKPLVQRLEVKSER